MRKKLFAVIMSIMMMVTFMPAMAFAVTTQEVFNVKWSFENDQVSAKVIYVDNEYAEEHDGAYPYYEFDLSDMTTEFIPGANHDKGYVKATLPTNVAGGYILDYATNHLEKEKSREYYDLTGASIVNYNETTKKESALKISADDYCKMVDQNTLTGPKLKTGYDIEDVLGDVSGAASRPIYIKVVDPFAAAGTEPEVAYVKYVDNTTRYLSTKTYTGKDLAPIIVTPTLPAYEKYQESQNFPVTLSFSKNTLFDTPIISEDLPINFINLGKAVTDYQLYIDSKKASNSVELIMDGMAKAKTINLSSSLKGIFSGNTTSNIVNALMLGFYNGADLNLHATTQGVDVQYSSDLGKTWGAAPALKDASLSYLEFAAEFVDGFAAMVEAAADGNLGDIDTKDLGKYASTAATQAVVDKLLNSVVFVKVTKGTSIQYGVILPVVLPREFIVEFKSSQLNFAPGKNVTTNDVLSAKAITGYDALSSMLNSVHLNKDEDNKPVVSADFISAIQSALELLGTGKTDVCAADKAYAEKFVEKYFTLKDMPTAGKDNKIAFSKNVQIDFASLVKDLKTDAELVAFLNNYDLLPELLTLDISSLGELPLELSVNIMPLIKSFVDGTIKEPTVSTDVVKLLKSVLGLVDTGVVSTATVNFGKEFTKITAKNVTKKLHVKKAKTLKKNKYFMYKATTDYGTVEYKKLSGNKKITVRDDGKVTVKKGLKKGKTYKVRIKVSVPEAGKYVKKYVKVKIVK